MNMKKLNIKKFIGVDMAPVIKLVVKNTIFNEVIVWLSLLFITTKIKK